jgi:hypothetical protein
LAFVSIHDLINCIPECQRDDLVEFRAHMTFMSQPRESNSQLRRSFRFRLLRISIDVITVDRILPFSEFICVIGIYPFWDLQRPHRFFLHELNETSS